MHHALTPEQYAARQQAYAKLAELVRGVDQPTVVIVLDGEQAHIEIRVPGTEELEQMKQLGQKAYWALTLYLEEIDRMLRAAEAEKTADASG